MTFPMSREHSTAELTGLKPGVILSQGTTTAPTGLKPGVILSQGATTAPTGLKLVRQLGLTAEPRRYQTGSMESTPTVSPIFCKLNMNELFSAIPVLPTAAFGLGLGLKVCYPFAL